MSRLRRHGKAELLEDGGAEFCRHHSLTGHVRRKEEAFKERTIGSCVGTHLVPEAGDSELVRAALDEVFSAADVGAGRCESAAGILDERAGGDVCAKLDRFLFVCKFAVAVIHEANGLRVLCFDDVNDLLDVFREEGVSEAVTARTLDLYELGVLIDHGCDAFQIIGVAFERHFLVVDAAGLQISRSVAGNAYDALHGVIGSADGGEHGIARFEESEKDGPQGMGAGDELRADESGLAFENVAPDLFELAAAGIIIAIAVGRCEMIGREVMLTESLEDLLRVVEGNFFHLMKNRRTKFERLVFDLFQFFIHCYRLNPLNCRYSVLVDQLGAVLADQKYGKAVEGLHFALELDTIHQEDADWHVFLSCFIQKCVLQIHFTFHLVILL